MKEMREIRITVKLVEIVLRENPKIIKENLEMNEKDLEIIKKSLKHHLVQTRQILYILYEKGERIDRANQKNVFNKIRKVIIDYFLNKYNKKMIEVCSLSERITELEKSFRSFRYFA